MSLPVSSKPTLQNAWESFPGSPGTSTTEVDENSKITNLIKKIVDFVSPLFAETSVNNEE
jgi:hypothetical protein